MSPTAVPAAPPTPQEIQRKLSVHSVSRTKPATLSVGGVVSGTESDSDSILTPDVSSPGGGHPLHVGGSSSQPPLTSIAERRSGSGEDTEDDEDGGEGEWKTADIRTNVRNSLDEKVLKAGYLWKKGERRKVGRRTWRKRWFVLRPAHIAYYKSSEEYQLLRLLELSDVHSCTQVNLKRHDHAFGLISPTRTFYLQASTPEEVQEWVKAIEEARQTHLATSTQTSAAATPIPIPSPNVAPRSLNPLSSSPPQASGSSYHPTFTSSDSEDASPPSQQDRGAVASPMPAALALSPSKAPAGAPQKDPAKVILSGYLMKCGSKRRNWRKRWFVLTGEKLVYSGSHMDTKPHRQFAFNEILDALEYQLQSSSHKQTPGNPTVSVSPPQGSPEIDGVNSTHTFKIVTTKRTLLLCAPSEDDEIKWLGAIRALIARRTESGLVPGKVSKSRSPEPRHEGISEIATVASSPPQGAGSGISGASGSSGLKGKVRRLSGAGNSRPEQEMKEAKTT